MATHQVNLDALIKRQDFETGVVPTVLGESPVFKLDELEARKTFFGLLRKPDFQRSTNNWTPEMIKEFIRSFLDKELIPALIIWHSQQTEKIYLIDGAHRLSALIAWVNDDYGFGSISKQFFGDNIPALQRRLHFETRDLIHDQIGSYADLQLKAANNPDDDTDVAVRRGRVLTTTNPPLQRVLGNAETAEKAFLRINGSPAIIDPTEFDIIKARTKPNTIATRALMQAGKGYQYWSRFKIHAAEIGELAGDVYDLLFGEIVEISSQSPDVPRAGQPYSNEAFKMVLDMVNVFNEVTPAMWQASKQKRKRANVTQLPDDIDGSETIAFLNRVKDVARLAVDPSLSGSLGLDPAVYCYGPDKFYPAAYLSALKFAIELKHDDNLFRFTSIRAAFEEFLVSHKSFIKDIGHSKGSGTRSLESLLVMYRTIMQALEEGVTDHDKIVERLVAQPNLQTALKLPDTTVESKRKRKQKGFPKAVQQAAVLATILAERARCHECGARLAPFSRSKDHIVPKVQGGEHTLENLRFTHPYCNSGYKEKKRHMAANTE